MKDYASKEERWEMIFKLISTEKIATQQQLLQRLEGEGFKVTQATISRDIKLMGLVKTADPEGGYYYKPAKQPEYQNIKEDGRSKNPYLDLVTGIACARNLVVVKCQSGMAQAICSVIDSMEIEYMLGSIAGDDTILLITREDEEAVRLSDYLNSIIAK